MRSKLAQIIETNSNQNLEGASNLLQKALNADNEAPKSLKNLLKDGFSMDQERLIGELQAELASKAHLQFDYQRLKRRYVQRKDEWARQVQLIEQR